MSDNDNPVEAKSARPLFLDRAEAESLKALSYKYESEATKNRAEARKAEAEAVEAEAKARTAVINAEREDHKRKKELAGDEFFHFYIFDSEVSELSVKRCIRQLSDWERATPEGEKLEIELQINSPGGSIFDGFALVDYITGMQARGHVINTSAIGMAASMGGVILQAGNTRRMGRSSMLLVHEASFGAQGSIGKVEDQTELVHLMQDRILDLFAERAKSTGREKFLSRAQIKTKWNRKDWWIAADKAFEYGFVDEIA